MTATTTRTLSVIDCAGSPRERGRAQGEGLREVIRDVIGRWSASIETRHGLPAGTYIAEFLAGTDFLPAIERFTPGLLAEVRGVAEGAGEAYETIFAYNLMDEEWTFGESRSALQPGCTAVCLRPDDGPPVIAQTMDIPAVHDGSQVSIRHKPDNGPETIVFTSAGMLALNGANAAGIGVVVNSLSMLPSSSTGLPVMFMIRGILERTSLTEAIDFVERTPHAIGQHYAIGSPSGYAGFEGAANGVRRSDDGAARYVHANHPLVNLAVEGDQTARYAATRTYQRGDRAKELLGAVNDQSGVESILADTKAPISCAPRRGFMTFGGTSIACSSPPIVRIAPGPPHLTDWTTVPL